MKLRNHHGKLKIAARIQREIPSKSPKEARHGVSGENMHQRSGLESENSYTAKNIKILKSGEAEERFVWMQAHTLAEKYCKPVAFIERGIEAYSLAGATTQDFIDRYLEKLPGAPRNHHAEVISRELQLKMR